MPGCPVVAGLRVLAGLLVACSSWPPLREYLPKNGWAENGTLGLGKSPQNLPLGGLHVRAPDRRGDRAARRAGAERIGVLRVADPHRGDQARREADEPGVGEVVDRAGLARRRAADLGLGARCRPARSSRGSWWPRRSRRPRRPCGGVGLPRTSTWPSGKVTLRTTIGLHAVAAVGDRRVRARHLQRRDAVGQAAQALGRVAVQRAGDAHVARGLGRPSSGPRSASSCA